MKLALLMLLGVVSAVQLDATTPEEETQLAEGEELEDAEGALAELDEEESVDEDEDEEEGEDEDEDKRRRRRRGKRGRCGRTCRRINHKAK